MKYSLPDSSNDLLIKDGKLLMRSLSIYEVIRRFKHILRLTPFRYEDFAAAILAEDQSALLAEIHIQLLKTLVREDRQQQTWLGPPDIRDSVSLYLHLADHSNWPSALRIYLSADAYGNHDTLNHLASDGTKCYPFNINLEVRLDVLEHLCDQFLLSVLARDEIVNGNSGLMVKHGNVCRLCSKANGDLVYCSNCPGVYHLKCSDPPLENYPDPENGDELYLCAVCRSNHVAGVSDCLTPDERVGNLKRHEALGLDKQGRRYWFLTRRLFVVDETEDDVRYYTTIKQFYEIFESLNENRFEKNLIDNLREQSEEIERQMKITEDLYASLLKDQKQENGTYSLMLGQDGTHRNYTNNYSLTSCPTNGKIHASERDLNRSLSNKFCMTISLKWYGATDGHQNTLLTTTRTTLLKFEAMLPSTFIHPCWQAHRPGWIKLVNNAQKPKEYAIALTKLESCIKPILFKAAWYDTVGFVHLFRSTLIEREEMKKTDRQPRGFEKRECVTADFELSCRLGTLVKFSSKLKPVKHQVWKQKGEEYRLTGLNGWYWRAKTHKPQVKPITRPTNKLIDSLDIEKRKETPSKNERVKPRLPQSHDFSTRRGKIKSILVLPQLELRRLARTAGFREVRSFSYTAKQNNYIWPYGMTPRPTLRTCWLYRNTLMESIQDVTLQLKVFHACIRWDDLQVRPPATGHNTIATDEATVTIELLKKRDKLPYLVHSEYLIRKVTTPKNEQPTKYRKTNHIASKSATPSARSGLRARRQVDVEKESGPTTEEIWVPEEQLELWELKQFDEKIERQNSIMRERARREEAEKRRRLEDEKRRAIESEKRRARQAEEAARRERLAQASNGSSAAANKTPMSPNANQNNTTAIGNNVTPQRSQPTTPVLRYFRTEQGQIIRLPASYLQRGTPLILRHVSPGTNQTNTYIIRPQASPVSSNTTTIGLRMPAPIQTPVIAAATPATQANATQIITCRGSAISSGQSTPQMSSVRPTPSPTTPLILARSMVAGGGAASSFAGGQLSQTVSTVAQSASQLVTPATGTLKVTTQLVGTPTKLTPAEPTSSQRAAAPSDSQLVDRPAQPTMTATPATPMKQAALESSDEAAVSAIIELLLMGAERMIAIGPATDHIS